MFKDVLNHANLDLYAQLGLVVFFAVFVLVVLRVIATPRRDIARWASLPLGDNDPGHREQEQQP